MKIALLIAAILIVLSSIPLLAQQANATAHQSASATAAGSHANASTSGNAAAEVSPRHVQASGTAAGSGAVSGPIAMNGSVNGAAGAAEQMRTENAELEKKLDSKSAKVGDQVVAKTKESVRTADGTVIPKGSRLVGHITEVQARERGHEDSQMGIEFDRAELKGGQSVAIHSVIRAISPPANALAGDSMDDDAISAPMAPMGGAAMGGGGRGMAGGRMGGDGGLLGGTVGGATGATGRMGAGLGSDLGSTTGGAMRTTGHVAGNAAAGVGNEVHGAAGATGALGAHATAIPGVMLDSHPAGSASGTLAATRRNIHLDSGTQMVLGIAADRQYAGK